MSSETQFHVLKAAFYTIVMNTNWKAVQQNQSITKVFSPITK